jgi:ABC-2 type transport system permease protein
VRVDPRAIVLVAKREYLDNIRTRGFWIGVLALPVMLVVAIAATVALQRSEGVAAYAVVDASGWLGGAVRTRILENDLTKFVDALDAHDARRLSRPLATLAAAIANVDRKQLIDDGAKLLATLEHEQLDLTDPRTPAETLAAFWLAEPERVAALAPDVSATRFRPVDATGTDRASLDQDLADETLLGYFVIPEDPVASDAGAQYVTIKLTNPELRIWYQGWVTQVVRERRLLEEDIQPAIADWIGREVHFVPVKIDAGGNANAASAQDAVAQWAPVAFVYLLWISIFTVTQMLLTNTIEEKSNRLVEVLLSSVAAVDLLAGKILGIATTGVTMVAVWLALLAGAAWALPIAFSNPSDLHLAAILENPLYIGSFVVYFLLGYLFYAAILSALGSLANNLKEAQTLILPVQLCLAVPLLVMVPIGRDPNGPLAAVLSWIPPFTPFVMMDRAAFPPSMITYVGTMALMILSIFGALSLAARIFEAGALESGKPPRFRTLLTLLRRARAQTPREA